MGKDISMKRTLEDCARTDQQITIYYDDDFDFFRIFIESDDDPDDSELEFTLSPIEAIGLARALYSSLEKRKDSTRWEEQE